jgi:hypothetical protein
MGTEHSTRTHGTMHAGAMPAVVELMQEMWELLTEEQKKKIMVMRMEILTQWMETEICNEEKMLEVKKKAIATIQKVEEMIK